MSHRKLQLLEQARRVLRVSGAMKLSARDALNLAKALAGYSLFAHAAAVLDITLAQIPPDDPLRKKMVQQQAVFTYKDTSQGLYDRLIRALALIESLELATTSDQETLGIAGSIYRRRWEASGRREHLEKSVEYYGRGEAIGIAGDDGYTAVNAAYVLDLLAALSAPAERRQELSERATTIRRRIAAELPSRLDTVDEDSHWWIIATLAEAAFGLGDFQEAQRWLGQADLSKVPLWHREATARRLAALAKMHVADADRTAAAWEWINKNLPDEAQGLHRSADGRVGLALSGGGFRATLVHLGVLARLAELDVLRQVEVLSTVSGGSIIGAYYYLAVRNLLQTKADADITAADYIDIVRRCIDCMLAGIRRNIRTRSLAEALPNLHVLLDPQFTRTDRIAELYDEYFYRCAPGSPADRPILMRELSIIPRDCPEEDFLPERHNWRRRNKVPTLVLNATALNTGHNWQFTPVWMGESRPHIDCDIDANYQLRRMYYDEAPARHRDLHLCRAVAASSCVPGLFPPVRFVSLYDGKLVALVDGAIHDNQGISSLLAEDCSICVISDGAGHMGDNDDPSLGAFDVMGRSLGILQTRVREIQHHELTALQRGSMVSMCFLHLKKGLTGQAIPWVGCTTRPLSSADESEPDSPGAKTEYGIPKRIQALLAGMRTDLDSFSDLEAYALMYDGYCLASQYVPQIKGLPQEAQPNAHAWPFLQIAPMMRSGAAAELERHLAVGASKMGKIFKLSSIARLWTIGLGAVILALFILLCFLSGGVRQALHSTVHQAERVLAWAIGVYLCVLVLALLVRHVRRWFKRDESRPSVIQLAFDLLVFAVGWIPARLHLWIGNVAYLRAGSLDNPAAGAMSDAPKPSLSIHPTEPSA